tara:strand:- start:331 stop:723 length:393 start_codon:yes stop_codon:yes gene_type:complete
MITTIEKIKPLISITVFFLMLSSGSTYADSGSRYKCTTEMFVAFPNNENPIRYENEDFTFFWKNDDTIVFGDEPLFKGAVAPIKYSSIELFDARLEFSTISYADGDFNYAQTLYQTITVIQAKCEKDKNN